MQSKSKRVGLLIALAIAIVFGGWYLTRGYGETGQQAYAYSMAVFSACNRRDAERLNGIVELIERDRQSGALSKREAGWLKQIINTALQGNWESANREIRKLMQDQVRYAPAA